MRAIFGLLLVMLGLAMAILWMPEHNGGRQLAEITSIATKGIAPARDRVNGYDDRHNRTFSPSTPLLATVEPAGPAAHNAALARVATPVVRNAQTEPTAGFPPARGSVGTSPVTSSFVATTSAVAPPSGQAIAPAAVVSVASPRVGDLRSNSPLPEMRRDELVRSIQRELKRVGCYFGEVDGDWGSGSRRAMSVFTDRINASLPTEQPDFIQLTLLRGQPDTVCGKGCPQGQTMGSNGRCVASAVVAQAVPRVTDRLAPRHWGAGQQAPPQQGAYQQGASQAAASQAAGAASSWPATVQREAVTATPIPEVATSRTAQYVQRPLNAPTSATPAAPLPGRMAIGGPGAGSAYVVPVPPERSAARDAVRASADDAAPVAAAPPARSKSRRTARRSNGWQATTYRYPVPSVGVYAPPRVTPRYYASAPSRRSRSWTGTFFGSNP